MAIKTILTVLTVFSGVSGAFGQEFWYESYRKSQDAILKGDWRTAIAHLDKAIQQKPEPELNAETYAMITVDYLPWFWRGVAAYNLGDVQTALANFEESGHRGAIQKSSFKTQIDHYSSLARDYLGLAQTVDSLKSSSALLEKRNARLEKRDRVLERVYHTLQRGDSTEAAQMLAVLVRENPQDQTLRLVLEIVTPKNDAQNPRGAPDQKFESAVDQFLAGNYQPALAAFKEIAREQPGRRNVESWVRLVSAEINKSGIPARVDSLLITKTDTIRSTAIPLVTATFDSVTSAQTIVLRGRAVDDIGIRGLEITVNGKPLAERFRRKSKLRPNAADDAANFQFHAETPLELGDNRIVMTARDLDAMAHSASYPILIKRQRPFYQQTPFILTAAGVLLIGLFTAVLSAMIRRRIAFVNKFNPYIAGAPIRDPRLFFGRGKLLRRILNTLDRNSILLHGPRRIGKTSFQHQLKTMLERQKNGEIKYIPVMIDLQGVAETRLFATMIEEIADACAPFLRSSEVSLRFHRENPEYSARDFNADLGGIIRTLARKFSGKFKLILQIDEVDALNTYSERTNQRLRGIFMKTYAENISAIMTGISIRKNWESEGSPWYNFFEEIPVEALDDDEAAALIQQPVRGVYKFESAAVERILSASQRSPYLIQKICMHTIYFMCEQKRRRVTLQDVENVMSEAGLS